MRLFLLLLLICYNVWGQADIALSFTAGYIRGDRGCVLFSTLPFVVTFYDEVSPKLPFLEISPIFCLPSRFAVPPKERTWPPPTGPGASCTLLQAKANTYSHRSPTITSNLPKLTWNIGNQYSNWIFLETFLGKRTWWSLIADLTMSKGNNIMYIYKVKLWLLHNLNSSILTSRLIWFLIAQSPLFWCNHLSKAGVLSTWLIFQNEHADRNI